MKNKHLVMLNENKFVDDTGNYLYYKMYKVMNQDNNYH